MSCNRKEKRGSLNTGIILIGVGTVFLMINMGWLPSMRHSWPLLLIVVGVALLLASRKHKNDEDQVSEQATYPISSSAPPMPPPGSPPDRSQTGT